MARTGLPSPPIVSVMTVGSSSAIMSMCPSVRLGECILNFFMV